MSPCHAILRAGRGPRRFRSRDGREATLEAQLRELLRLDLDAVDLRKGLTGSTAILAFAVFVAIFGTIGMVAGLATLFVILADQPGPMRDRGISVLRMTVFGSSIALVAGLADGQHIAVAAILTFVVVAIATLAAGFGPAIAMRGMLLSVWAVVAVSMAGETDGPLDMAVAFAAGGLLAGGVIWARSRALPEPSSVAGTAVATQTLREVVRSPLGWFALLRASAAGLAMLLGAMLFPEHPSWAALTVVLLMKSKAGETIASGLLRTIGTLAGVIVAEGVIRIGGDQGIVVIVGFMVFAFGMAALQKVNYAVFVACLTGVLVLADQLARGTGEVTAIDRLLGTLLGAAIALISIGLGRLMLGRPVIVDEPARPAEGDDQTPG